VSTAAGARKQPTGGRPASDATSHRSGHRLVAAAALLAITLVAAIVVLVHDPERPTPQALEPPAAPPWPTGNATPLPSATTTSSPTAASGPTVTPSPSRGRSGPPTGTTARPVGTSRNTTSGGTSGSIRRPAATPSRTTRPPTGSTSTPSLTVSASPSCYGDGYWGVTLQARVHNGVGTFGLASIPIDPDVGMSEWNQEMWGEGTSRLTQTVPPEGSEFLSRSSATWTVEVVVGSRRLTERGTATNPC